MKNKHAFLLTAPCSGSGKTSITLGLIYVLKDLGFSVQAFKAGPDYLDTSYHSLASGKSVYNLDTWIMKKKHIKDTFYNKSFNNDISIIEGAMGYLDGYSGTIKGSSYDLARLLKIPVILVVNCAGFSGSIAPL